MGSRMKEDERIEREIRSLSKLPENRRCINCNTLGPQYVCTTFWTFVCTNCSGVQREFNHRVKSVSMAKFTAEEVNALQVGGNEKAKEIYFKEWDPHCHPYPDSNNTQKLRDFIRHVYVDRKFTGERSHDNLPKLRLDNKEESYQRRMICITRSPRHHDDRNYPRSPSLINEDKSVKLYYDERRSPKYSSRNGNQRRNPITIEVVDDRFRDDESRSRRLSSLESKLTMVSPKGQKNVDKGKKVALDSGERLVKENPAEPKNNNAETHINSSIVICQDSHVATVPETQPVSQSNGSDWASFEVSIPEEAPQTPNTNTSKSPTIETTHKTRNAIEFLLSELSGSFYATASDMSKVLNADNNPSTVTIENVSIGGDFAPTSGGQVTELPNNDVASSVTSTKNSELTQPSTARSAMTQPMSPPVKAAPSNNQSIVAPSIKVFPRTFSDLSLQSTSKPAQDTKSDFGSQPTIVEIKSTERKELPADSFFTSYLSGPAPQAGWQNVQPHNMGYNSYPYATTISTFPTTTKYKNPFIVTEGRTQVHASPFSTMATLQGAQPAISTRTRLVHASSIEALGSIAPHSPHYTSSMPSVSPFTSEFPTGPYFEQVNNNMQPHRPQRASSLNIDRTIQQSGGGYMAPGSAKSYFPRTSGNPFG